MLEFLVALPFADGTLLTVLLLLLQLSDGFVRNVRMSLCYVPVWPVCSHRLLTPKHVKPWGKR